MKRLTLCYCDLAFNKGRPVFAVCDRCEAAHLETVLERRGLVARELPAAHRMDALREVVRKGVGVVSDLLGLPCIHGEDATVCEKCWPIDPPERPDWPKNDPTADEMIRYAAAWACWLGGHAWGYIDAGAFDTDDPTKVSTFLRYSQASSRMIHMHDLVVLLKAIKEVDPAAADEAAAQVWLAADAGDSYGEWTWQWAKELGLDPDGLYKDGKAKAGEQSDLASPDDDPPSSDESTVQSK